MAVNKIKISANTRKVLNKTKEILGIQGENMKDVLFFALSEKIDGTAVVEIELPNGVQSFVELIKVEDGYELPVKSVLTEQAGFVKFQLRILQNKVEVFKSEIFELEVKESLNAIYEAPEEYPTWLDKLEDLQTELNNSEKERISNENERIESEEARKENFTQMQESVKGAISNIKDLTENYNLNATEKTNKFDENYTEKKKAFDDNYSETLKSFNDNAETKYDNYNKNAENKTSEYNKNNDEKLKAYNDNHTTKITNFDTNTKNKTDEYNSNASKKLDDYNSNDTTKTEKYNENATTKLSDYNSNATAKKKEYDTNAENKIVEFNNNATEKLDEYNQNAESLTNRVIECESENERLRNDIKSIALPGEASGENIHLEDSSNARCEIEIGGNHQQETREGYNQFKITSTQTQSAGVTITKIDESSVSYQGTTTVMFTHMLVEYDGKGLEITKQMYLKAFGNLTNAILSVKLIKNGKTESSYLRVSPDLILSAGDVLQQIYVQQQNTGILISGTLQVLLTDYENKDKPYEQYGASPSILYSSSVKAVGDIKNILDMSNAKNGASAGIICTTNADGSYKYKGTATSQYINVWFMGGYATDLPTLFTLEPGTYYINDVSLFEGTTGFANDSSKKIWTFIRAYNVTGVRAVGAVSGNTYDETKYPIIAKIDHEIPWVPYEMGYIKVNEFNKNYLSKIPKKSITTQGITSTFDGEKFICKGTAQANYFNLLTENVYKKIGKGIKTLSTNKLKKGRVFIHLDYVDGTSQNYYTSINTNRASFTLNKDVESYRLNVDSITAGDTIDDNIYVQLEDGNIATEIEKAENQEYLVDVQQEMLEGDTFVRQDGKWYEMHGFGVSDTFNNENINISSTSIIKTNGKNFYRHHLVFANDIKRKKGSYIKILSTHFKYNDSRWNTLEGICGWEAGNSFCIGTYDENYNTAEKMQTFLMNNHVKIYYELAELILLECTKAQSKVLDEIYSKAHTYKNITNISAESAKVNPIVSLKYLKDVETEHNKLQAQIDEIKQLLSTTETSAMLLNNMQTDLESEV